jgi:hypothetical protein
MWRVVNDPTKPNQSVFFNTTIYGVITSYVTCPLHVYCRHCFLIYSPSLRKLVVKQLQPEKERALLNSFLVHA